MVHRNLGAAGGSSQSPELASNRLQIPGGRSRSFHSFRVHMATNIERAKVEESTAVWIMGQTRTLLLTNGLYSKGKDIAALKEAMGAIPAPAE
jgi:hypothetical protein